MKKLMTEHPKEVERIKRALKEIYQALKVPSEAYLQTFVRKFQTRASKALFEKKTWTLGTVLISSLILLATFWLVAKGRKR